MRRAVGSGLRAIFALAPLVGLVPRPEQRPNGISALVRVRGEEEWLEPCVRSIEGFADDIVVLDNGAAPPTADALERLCRDLGPRLRVERCRDLDVLALSNRGLEIARSRWVIRWDADFVARTDGEHDIGRLRERLLGLDRRQYHLVYVPAVEVAGDLAHQFPDRRIRVDGAAHTASPRARYVAVERDLPFASLSYPDRMWRDGALRARFESLRVPRYYRVHQWPVAAYFHVDVKSRRHMFLRHFWLEWLRKTANGGGPTLEAYAHARAADRWGIGDPDAAADALVARYCEGLAPFDPSRCGPYPAALRPYLDKPRYRVEYARGRIVGRTDRD